MKWLNKMQIDESTHTVLKWDLPKDYDVNNGLAKATVSIINGKMEKFFIEAKGMNIDTDSIEALDILRTIIYDTIDFLGNKTKKEPKN